MKTWDPEAAVTALAEGEAAFLEDTNWDDPDQAKTAIGHIFRTSARDMALAVVHIGIHDPNSRMRFQAATYVLDHVMKTEGGDADPLTKMVAELTSLVRDSANPTNG